MNIIFVDKNKQYNPAFKKNTDKKNLRNITDFTAGSTLFGGLVGSLGTWRNRYIDIKNLHKVYDKAVEDLALIPKNEKISKLTIARLNQENFLSWSPTNGGLKKEDAITYFEGQAKYAKQRITNYCRYITNKKIIKNGAIGAALGTVVGLTVLVLIKLNFNWPKKNKDNN